MFADDVGLLPGHMFTRMLEQARRSPTHSDNAPTPQRLDALGVLARALRKIRPNRSVTHGALEAPQEQVEEQCDND